jgi:hypothetical protein
VLVVVDDVDVFTSDDELLRRWELLGALAARGATVVAGASREPREASGATWTTLTLPVADDPRRATEEATL